MILLNSQKILVKGGGTHFLYQTFLNPVENSNQKSQKRGQSPENTGQRGWYALFDLEKIDKRVQKGRPSVEYWSKGVVHKWIPRKYWYIGVVRKSVHFEKVEKLEKVSLLR